MNKLIAFLAGVLLLVPPAWAENDCVESISTQVTCPWTGDPYPKILLSATVSPSGQSGGGYDCIVCPGQTITVTLNVSTTAGQKLTRTCYTGCGNDHCDGWSAPQTGSSPTRITNRWINHDGSYITVTNNVFSTNYSYGVEGWVRFLNVSYYMPPGECGASVIPTSIDKSYAVVDLVSLTCGSGMEVDDKDNNPNTILYLVRHGPGYATVTATGPGVPEQYLPACRSFNGGDAVGLGRLQRRVSTCTPGKFEFTARAGSNPEKKVTVVVYKAEFRLKAQGADLPSLGHSWWELYLSDDAKDVVNADYPHYLGGSLGEAGFWPYGWTVIPGYRESGPAMVEMGTQEGHTAEAEYSWDTTIDHLLDGANWVHNLVLLCESGQTTFDLRNNNCTTEATKLGNDVYYLGIPNYMWPGDLRDYLQNLTPPTEVPCP